LETKVFSSVEGAPSWYSFQPWPSPSTSATVPRTCPHCGISAFLDEPFSFSTFAEADIEAPSAATAAQATNKRDAFISQSPDWFPAGAIPCAEPQGNPSAGHQQE